MRAHQLEESIWFTLRYARQHLNRLPDPIFCVHTGIDLLVRYLENCPAHNEDWYLLALVCLN